MLQASLPPDPPGIIIVTGQALPDPAADRAYAVDILDREDLARTPSHQLDQALKQVAGLQLFRRSDSTSGHPTSQGVTLRSLGGSASSRALLIFDGVPQADPFGGWVNWPAYDPESLARVRVVRGGGSVVHGPGALAGIIDLSSISDVAANATMEVGSRTSLTGRGYVGLETGPGSLTVNVRGARSKGFSLLTKGTRGPVDQRAPYQEASFRARWILPVASDVELQAGGLAFLDIRERGLPFTENRTRGADLSLRLVGTGSWQWSATSYAQWRNFRSSFASVDEDRTIASRVAFQDAVPSSGFGAGAEVRPLVGNGIELRLGGDVRFTDGESRELVAYVLGEPSRRRVAGGESATTGVFADVSWIKGRLTLTGGARLDRWHIGDGMLSERVLATGGTIRNDHHADRNGWRPSARIAALIDLDDGFSFRSAAYLSWRMPTLNELFRPFRVGADATAANPLLDPERLAGAELGLGYTRSGLDLSVTAFANRLSDSIGNVTLGQGPGIFPGVGFVAGSFRQRQNLDAVEVQGLEASAEARRGPWSLRLAGSYSHAKVEARGVSATLDGLRPAQTPNFTLSAGLAWQRGGHIASLLLTHTGAQYEDDLNKRRLAPATSIDGYLAWPLSNRLQFIVRGENLLNETIIAGIGDDGTIERATPRTLWIGLKSRFQ